MADYTRTPQRFFYRGISLLPEDALPEGNVAYALNLRSYQHGTVTPRWGSTRESSSAMPSPVHSLFRLNDTSLFGGGNPERRFAGSGTTLYVGPPSPGAYNSIVTGQSGNPLTAVSAAPINSPRPYLYVADSVTMRKINSSLNDYPIGISTPDEPPSALLAGVQTTFLETVDGAGSWVSYASGTAPGQITRITAVVLYLIYDSGTTGWASIALDDMTGVVAGMTVQIDLETVIVQDVNPPVSPTTIGRILYDSGSSGLCTIQPSGSFSIGQIEAPLPDAIRRRYEDLNLPVPPKVTVSRTVDFPVNSLVTLSGIETVRILSVAIGQDGKQSFRCSTASTHSAGGAIVGVTSFRGATVINHVAGAPASGLALENTLTPLNVTDPIVGGIQSPMSGSERNWGLVGTQATQPDDIIRFGVRVSQFAYLTSVRLMMDVDPLGGTPVTFLQNYYFYEWRGNDLLTAVQAAIGTPTALMSTAQSDAVTQGIVDAQYSPEYGADPSIVATGVAPAPKPNRGPVNILPVPVVGRGAPNYGVVNGTLPTDSFVTAGGAPSRQLTLGDNQWIVLQCRVGDLTRVGTDTTRTLGQINSAAYVVQAQGTTNTLTFDFSDCYLTGGYGPDVGATLPPYVYRYRFRSTVTGERSNPSPPMRGGIAPHRGRVLLTPGDTSGAPQCDTIDWFRYGGALARWQYTGSQPNTATAFSDDNSDSQIDGGENLRTDLFQPWPTPDLPRSGTAILAGTALRRVAGDNFNTNWSPTSVLIVNGKATTLYRQPVSATFAEVVDNCGDGATVDWSAPAPTLLGQALPSMWGGPINDVWFHFAVGSAADPSLLHWTHGNDPDATSEINTLVVSSASEPLQNGCFYDGISYVFSTEKLYRITPTFGQVNSFRADETPCTKGLWSPWFMAVAPEGIYFGSKDGIYLTAGGGQPVSITDGDISVLFPQDGSADDITTRGLSTVDFTAFANLKLSYGDGLLYFDYQDTQGALHTLVYASESRGWTPDVYVSGITARISEPGPQVHSNLYGCANGQVYQADATVLTDDGSTVNWQAWTPWANGGDARISKQFGDAVVDAIPGQGGFTVTPVYDNGASSVASTTVAASAVRVTSLVEVNAGNGVISRNFGLKIVGALTASVLPRPLLYIWEPAFLPKQTIIARRATDWDDLGYVGAKFIQGIVVRADTFGSEKLAQAQYEGGHVGAALTLLHDGETQYAYPISDQIWTPFVAEMVRLIGMDDLPWMLLDARWVWEPAPEAATQWQTQETTFDLPGFMDARDGIIAYMSHCPVTLTVWHENGSHDYILPPTNDVYLRYYQPFIAAKGKWVRFRLTGNSPFRVFAKDTKIRIQGWGVTGGYMLTTPFGGPSRSVGAEI